jgi:hypothetical protein
MPLKQGKSQKTISANIHELMTKPDKIRAKAVKTIATESGITTKEAQRRQAVAIALTTAKALRNKSKK